MFSEQKDPDLNLISIANSENVFTLINNHYYIFIKWRFEEDETLEIRDGTFFYGKFHTPNNEEMVSFDPNNFESDSEEEEELTHNNIKIEGKMSDLYYFNKNNKLIPFHNRNNFFLKKGIINKNEMTFVQENKLKDYVFYILEDDTEEQRKQKQETILLSNAISNRFGGIDFLPYLYNMPEPDHNSTSYQMQKKRFIIKQLCKSIV